ncbi:hypothetical protein NQ317_014918 [Molorchus minor]|uniref:Uncharacterized protein n=1 Tax=Molorchus minor TaxID=1323400 RepID=A0ABQ9JAI6_9CUCU|nr:hypothetical protein NQ317_014918 [Molorchus minor]
MELGFIVSDSSSDGPEICFREPNSKDDAICVFCNGKFFEDIRGELWVQGIMCEMWAHCDCADCEKHDYVLRKNYQKCTRPVERVRSIHMDGKRITSNAKHKM